MSKKFIDDASNVVFDSLEGFLQTQPNLCWDPEQRVVYRRDIETIRNHQVTLISGGGSGHEPAQTGFVCKGMLSAAVCGDVFASPSTSQILRAIRLCTGSKGSLLIVTNYTGDRLQFGRACERAKAEGYKVDMVVIGEDCALPKERTSHGPGRRGLAGTLLVHKILGYASEQGMSLEDMKRLGETILKNMGTYAVASSSCSLPGKKGNHELVLSGDMELGLGAHGEAGFQKCPMGTASNVVEICLKGILESGYVNFLPGDELAVVLNNLGGLSALEMGVLIKDCIELLKRRGYQISHLISGPLMTSMEMAGVSITLLRSKSDNLFQPALSSPTESSFWPKYSHLNCNIVLVPSEKSTTNPSATQEVNGTSLSDVHQKLVKKALENSCKELIRIEPQLTEYDRIVGDGDCGTTFKQGAEAILNNLESLSFHNLSLLFNRLSKLVEGSMGGTSGAVLCILMDAISAKLLENGTKLLSASTMISAFSAGVSAIQVYGRAQLGDRTILDALIPAVQQLMNETADLKSKLGEASKCATQGAEDTATIDVARSGRSSYLSSSQIKGTPDPGAIAASVVIREICNVFINNL